jgi:N-acylneuraminate cytidylyltransferase
MSDKKVHAIILARGGSKGIKNKNLIVINKKPLIYWTIKSCLKTKNIKYVWVSSDKKKILSYAKKLGAKIIFRPKNLSSDTSTSESGWLHAIKKIQKKIKIQHVVALQATSPIRNKQDLSKAIKLYFKNKSDSLFSAGNYNKLFTWFNKKKLVPNYNIKIKRTRRQNQKKMIIENGSFYIFNSEKFIKNKKRLFGKINYYLQKKFESFEIDDYEDLYFLDLLMKGLPKNYM